MAPVCVLEGRGGLRLQEGFLQTENRSPVLKGWGLEPGSHVLKYEACWSLTPSLLRTSLESPEEKAWISLSKVLFLPFPPLLESFRSSDGGALGNDSTCGSELSWVK